MLFVFNGRWDDFHVSGLRSFAKYRVRGRVFNSPNRAYARGSAASFAARLLWSFKSPKTNAPAGQACAQAGVISPSATGRFSALAAGRAS